MRSQVCTHNNWPIVKTKIHSMIKNVISFLGGGGGESKNSPLHHSNKKRNPPSHKSHLRGEFTPFLKMKLRTWMNVCKNPDWRITINKSTC